MMEAEPTAIATPMNKTPNARLTSKGDCCILRGQIYLRYNLRVQIAVVEKYMIQNAEFNYLI